VKGRTDVFMGLLALYAWRLLQSVFLTLEVLQQLSRQLRQQLRQWRSLDLPQKTPLHLGIIIASEDAADAGGVAAVVCASAVAGVRYVTLCEASGELARAVPALRAELHARGLEDAQVLTAGEAPVTSSEELAAGALCVRVVTLGSGRDDLVVAAQRVCDRVVSGRLAHDAVDEAAVDSELSANEGFPEPVRARARLQPCDGRPLSFPVLAPPPAARAPASLAPLSRGQRASLLRPKAHCALAPVVRALPSQELILQCCPEHFLGGLLPWHCRITQFVYLGALRHATAERIRGALVEYGGVQQRHGK
jgi:hypothetical protein